MEQQAESAEVLGEETPASYYDPRPLDLAHVTVADGFRFGCGLILAGVGFAFVLIIVLAMTVLVAALLNIRLPFGI